MNRINVDKKHPLKLIVGVLATICIPALLATAEAADVAGDTPQVVVRYADLTLSRQADVATLYRRIERAANRVCDAPEPRDLARAAAAKPCIARAVADAVAQINSPLLTGLYATKMGGEAKLQIATR